MNGYYKLVIDVLKKNGFTFYRQGKGSHEFWSKGQTIVMISVTCASKFTANGIMKDAGINHKF